MARVQLLDPGDGGTPGRILVPGPVVDADELVAVLSRMGAEVVELVVEPSQVPATLGDDADAVVTVSGYPEAVKRVEGDVVAESVDRSRLLLAGPPMAARTSVLRDAFEGGSGTGHVVEVLVRSGAVVMVAGSPPA